MNTKTNVRCLTHPALQAAMLAGILALVCLAFSVGRESTRFQNKVTAVEREALVTHKLIETVQLHTALRNLAAGRPEKSREALAAKFAGNLDSLPADLSGLSPELQKLAGIVCATCAQGQPVQAKIKPSDSTVSTISKNN